MSYELSQKRKKRLSTRQFFVLLGYELAKAARRTFMKLTSAAQNYEIVAIAFYQKNVCRNI